MVSWLTVCRPTDLGGVGISDLKLTGLALQTKWLWLQKVTAIKLGASYLFRRRQSAFFRASTFTIVCDGRQALFWEDRWIDGESTTDIAPCLAQMVTKRTRRSLTVCEGLTNRA